MKKIRITEDDFILSEIQENRSHLYRVIQNCEVNPIKDEREENVSMDIFFYKNIPFAYRRNSTKIYDNGKVREWVVAELSNMIPDRFPIMTTERKIQTFSWIREIIGFNKKHLSRYKFSKRLKGEIFLKESGLRKVAEKIQVDKEESKKFPLNILKK